jgi:hypothetical protein
VKREAVPAKDGTPTVLIDGKFLHSRYAPLREATRTAAAFVRESGASVLFVIGEGVPYLSAVLAEQHPDLRVYAILIGTGTDDRSDGAEPDPARFPDHMYAATGEEERVRSWVRQRLHPFESGNVQAFLWPAADSVAPEWTGPIKREVLAGVQDVHSELATVASFGGLWLKNALRRTIAIDDRWWIQPAATPTVLVGGGPGVSHGARFLASRRDAYTIIAVSSATSALAAHGITPDIVFHTDAGFWAQRYRRATGPDGGGIPTVVPLRAGMQPGVPFPTTGEILVRHGWFGEALAPDALEWPKITEAPTVTASMISWVREHSPPTAVYLLGIDLCSYDLTTHAAPHPNDRFITAGASRLRPEMTARAERSGYATGESVVRWADDTAGFQTPALQAFVQPVRTMIATLSRTHTVGWIAPSPVWPDADDITKDHRPGASAGPHRGKTVVREARRPDRPTRRKHALRVLAQWSELLDGGVHAGETQDVLLHLAPVATLRERRGDHFSPGAVHVARNALATLTRLAADG